MCEHTKPHVKVEYDENFWGGDYDDVGSFAFIKLSDVIRLRGVKTAFRAIMDIDPVHIIHYSEDDLYDASGNPF